MNLADARLAPSPGADGLVARTSGAVLFVAARTPVTEVARLVEAVTAADDPAPGRHLARALATLVGSDTGALPGFAVVAASTGGIYVKAYGPVEVRIQGEGGETLVSAVGSFTGLDRELSGSFHTILAHRAGEAAPVPAFDLDVRAGTSPGSGFALTTLTGPTDAPAPEPPAPAAEAAPATAAPAEPASSEAEPAVPDAPASDDDDAEAPPPTAAPLDPEPAGLDATQAWSADDVAAATSPTGPVDAASPGADPAPAPPAADEGSAVGSPWAEEPITAPAAEPTGFTPSPEGASAIGAAEQEPRDEPRRDGAPPQHEPATLPPTALAGFTSQLLGALDEEEVPEREPLPVDLNPGEVRAPDQSTHEIMVQGVLCSRGHFNDPRSRYCSSCGISMVQNTQVLTPGPRPPLGVLVFEDGATFSLAQDYVVGRQPEVSEAVQQGLALPLPVDDPERSISRAHAELRLVDWDVHLINLSATNGSFVWDEHQRQWVPIPTGQSVLLAAGMRVALGRRSAVFESSLAR